MDGMRDWLFPSTQIGALIRFRPLTLELFYRRNLDPWGEQGSSIAAFCSAHGLHESNFVRELADLPVMEPDTHWEKLPCYHLIDYLIDEHRIILHTDIPAIRYLLDMGFPEEEGSGLMFRSLTKSIGDFTDRLRTHYRHEEENILPIMLANDFLLNHRPDLLETPPLGGKIQAAGPLIEEEERFKRTLDLFLETAGLSGADSYSSKAYLSVAWLMKSLGIKLRAQAHLKMDVLFPMASRMEREMLSMSPTGA